MKTKHLIIVTYNWPPRNAIGTHRPYAWAKAWVILGGHVTVVTSKKQAFDQPLDLELPPLPNVRLIEVPWHHAASSFGRLLLHNEKLRDALRRLRRILNHKLGANNDIRDGWFKSALTTVKELANSADLVITTFGPSSSHLLGAEIKSHNPNAFWIADYRDLWGLSDRSLVSHTERAKQQSLEQLTVGTYADLVTAVSEDMVQRLGRFLKRPTYLLPNGFDMDEQVVANRLSKPKNKISKEPFRIVYTGTLYQSKHNPEPLLVALCQLHREGLISRGEVILEFYGSRIDVARKLAEVEIYKPYIRIRGHVSREEALTVQCEADLLLILESHEPSARGIITGKIFEYIVSGTPILAIGSRNDYEIPLLLTKTRTGVSFMESETEKIKAFIISMLRTRETPIFYKPDIDNILEYSRIRQSTNLFRNFIQ